MPPPYDPPTGYSFINGVNDHIWSHPDTDWQNDYDQPENMAKIVLVHDVCGCFVAEGRHEAHDAWHTSLTPSP